MGDAEGAAARTSTPGREPEHGVRQKIVDVADLARVRQAHRRQTIVLCHGAFDLVHMGHIIHFDEARAQGDQFRAGGFHRLRGNRPTRALT